MAGTTPLGTTVTITDGVSPLTLSDVLDVNYSPGSTELIDITDLSDTTRVKLAGYVDTGSLSVTINFTDTVYADLIAFANGSSLTCTVTFGNAGVSTWSGSGVVDMAGFAVSGGSGVTSSFSIHQLSAWAFEA